MFDVSHTRIGKNARAIHTEVINGVVSIKDSDSKGNKWIEKVRFIDEQVMEYKIAKNGHYTYWIKYGEFEKARKDHTYSYIKRFSPKSAKGYHGLTTRYDTTLFGMKGICYTFYSRGHWLWQKFVYPNGRVAYHTREQIFKGATVEGVYPNGNKLFKIVCANGFVGKTREGYPFINKHDNSTEYDRVRYYHAETDKMDYSKDGNCEYTIWDRQGRVKEQGKIEKRQKTGEWITNYKRYFMLNGLEVPKALYDAKPEDLDPNRVLKEKNAQVRAMLLKKIGMARVVKECKGTLIDKDTSTGNELYDFKTGTKITKGTERWNDTIIESHERVLKVVCPSTQNEYFLRIPYDEHFNTTEKARQGTFNGFEVEGEKAKPIEFAMET